MSEPFQVAINHALRVGHAEVQKWIIMPTGEITEWQINGSKLQSAPSNYSALYFATVEKMLIGDHAQVEIVVLDERDLPMSGIIVQHGWPTSRYPDADEIVDRTTDRFGKVTWTIFAEFNPMEDIGPLWVRLAGYQVSDVVMGLGIPMVHTYKALIGYKVVFRRRVINDRIS